MYRELLQLELTIYQSINFGLHTYIVNLILSFHFSTVTLINYVLMHVGFRFSLKAKYRLTIEKAQGQIVCCPYDERSSFTRGMQTMNISRNSLPSLCSSPGQVTWPTNLKTAPNRHHPEACL